jgi:hypothetical protein
MDGKLYDYNLNVVYDYEADEYTISEMFGTSILFTNDDGEYVLFANGNYVDLITAKEAKDGKLYLEYADDGIIVIRDASSKNGEIDFVVYNESGEEIYTFADYYDVDVAKTGDDYIVIAATQFDADEYEYNTTYYKLK